MEGIIAPRSTQPNDKSPSKVSLHGIEPTGREHDGWTMDQIIEDRANSVFGHSSCPVTFRVGIMSSRAAPLKPNDFQTLHKIGEGAYSKVFLKRHVLEDKLYAVKVLKRLQDNDDDEAQKRIIAATKREVRILSMCQHPNIIQFFATMQTEDEVMYVTEYCEGGDLGTIIRTKRTIPLPAARYITAQITSALVYLHSAEKRSFPMVAGAPLRKATIIHRDIKPQNIVLSGTRQVKLIDFGSASNPLEEIPANHVMSFVGTVHYMSPEMLQNPDNTSPATDYWSLGCVLFEMLVGRRPFEGATYPLMNDICNKPVEVPSWVDADASDLIRKLLEKEGESRLTGTSVLEHPFVAPAISWSAHDIAKAWIRNAEWETDRDVNRCRTCQRDFSLLRRRHHCRNCGRVFCHDCSDKVCPIPDSTYRAAERVCNECYANLVEASA
jgi:serine/threonine protein kinase